MSATLWLSPTDPKELSATQVGLIRRHLAKAFDTRQQESFRHPRRIMC
jgi:hypothetical protein